MKHRCPLCNIWYTPATGNQPIGSKMCIKEINGKLSCHPDAKGLYEITYIIPSGIQSVII